MNNIAINDFGYLRVAASSPKSKVLDIEYNYKQIEAEIEHASLLGAQTILFPELALTGYSGGDLFRQNLIYKEIDKYLRALCKLSESHSICIIIGLPLAVDSKLLDVAAVIANGEIKGFIPNNVNSAETSNFSNCNEIHYYTHIGANEELQKIPISNEMLFNLFDKNNNINCKIGVVLGDDFATALPHSSIHALNGANVIFNLAASTEFIGKAQNRLNHISYQSSRTNTAYIYASAGAGESTTDSVFSGHCVIAECGEIIQEAMPLDFNSNIDFNSNTILADIDIELINSNRIKSKADQYKQGLVEQIKINHNLDIQIAAGILSREGILPSIQIASITSDKLLREISSKPFIPNDGQDVFQILKLQSIGLIKRMQHINCSNIVLGLSGGLDSTLALLVAVEAYKKMGLDLSGIHCIMMPGFGTSDRTKSNAELLAKEFGTNVRTISIHKAVEQHFIDIGHNPENTNVVYENAQARERTQILMDISNQVNGIVLGTGDLSEIALGWSTYNGDHISMYNVNCGVPKTLARYMVEYLSTEDSKNHYSSNIRAILKDIAETPISPELLPLDKMGAVQQKTEESVGSYQLNDFILYHFIHYAYEPKKLYLLANIAFDGVFSSEYIKSTLKSFYRRFFVAQFKRSCSPDGPQVCSISLSPRGAWKMATDSVAELWLRQVDSL